MSGENQKGFTIIETSLFLAISAMLFMGLLGGISLSVQRQRYSDSIQSSYSFLQKQFDETLNVVNSRENDLCGTSSIGASECIVMGKAIKFTLDQDTFEIFTIIGKDPILSPGVTPSTADYQPRIVKDINAEEYFVPWGTKVVKAKSQPGSQDKNLVLLIRSPENGATSIYALNKSEVPFGEVLGSSDLNNANRVTGDNKMILCMKSEDIASTFARLEFNGVGSQDGITAKFDQGNNCGLS